MRDFEFHSPSTLSEACELLKKHKGSIHVLAGGTDLIPKIYYRLISPEHVLNLKKIPELKEITFDQSSGLTLGALTRFNDIIYSKLVQRSHPILIETSKSIASHQVRNLATIGGNLCNAAPSADSAPVLIALGSTVQVAGPNNNQRTLELEQFFTGPGTTVLSDGELLIKIHVPVIKPRTGIAYIKHTMRQALEIAIVGVAGLIQLKEGSDNCINSRLVIGACAPTPFRIKAAEEQLNGKPVTERTINNASAEAAAVVKPISDVRGSEGYRREMVKVLTKRVLEHALERAKEVK